MRSKQYFTSIKNNPHEISTDPLPDHSSYFWRNMSVLKISCDNLHGLNGRIEYPLG